MKNHGIIYSISISSVIAYPRCLHWTPDGQVCFLTNDAVYIYTPDHGINFDTDAVVPSSNKDGWHLGWFKTVIEMKKITPTRWTDYSQSWPTVSIGSLDDSVVSIAISPTGLTTNGGCVVATLSANMDVVLWMAGKIFIKGEWVKISEITPTLLAKIYPSECILQAQITSIEWTTQVDFDWLPAPRLDGSLFILGSRAGFITLLRYNTGDSVEYLQTLSISDHWIRHLTFDSWRILAPGHCEGNLAYGASDGSIGLIKISQKLKQSDVRSFAPQFDIEVAMESTPRLVYQAHGNAGTLLQWVPIPGRSSILVSSSPGLLKLFSQPQGSSTTHWTGYRIIRLTTQKTSRNSSALYPPSGLTYLSKLDALVVTLTDGSFHVVQNLSTEPNIADSSSLVARPENFRGWLTSDELSHTARMTFHKTEKGNADQNDTCRIHGVIPYDGDATFMWAYESFSPSDFSYKQDSKRSSTLIVSQLWNDNGSCGLLENLALLLSSAKTCWGVSPLHMLRPYFLHLRNLLDCYGQLLDVVLPIQNDDCSKRVVIPSWDSKDINVELRKQFRIGLATNLYGWDELLSLRLRLSLADFAWKMSGSEEIRSKCGVVAEVVLNAISSRISRIIIRHWVAVAGLLDLADLPFASRLVMQSTLHGMETHLREEGNELSTLLPIFNSSTGTTQNMYKLDETCPACGVTIPFEVVNSARCTNGHVWPRCSVTTFVLATSLVRTCVGCCRKAFLPPSALVKGQGQELPNIAQSWVVEELLNAVTKCLFCGNGFVSIL